MVVIAAAVFVPNTAHANTCGNTYTVKPGDHLYKIATYCDVPFRDIMAANPKVSNWNLIYPGQVFSLIKPAATATPGATTTTTTTKPSTISGRAAISVNQTSAIAGEMIMVTGTNFDADTTFNLMMGPSSSSLFKVAAVTTDSKGVFIKVITLPTTLKQNSEYMFLARSPNKIGTFYHFKIGSGVVSSGTTTSGSTTTAVVPTGAKFLMDPSTFKPGASITFEVRGFPKNQAVDVLMGKVGASPSVIIDAFTDANGAVSKIVTIPSSAQVGDKWEIRVATTQLNNGVSISSSFTIR